MLTTLLCTVLTILIVCPVLVFVATDGNVFAAMFTAILLGGAVLYSIPCMWWSLFRKQARMAFIRKQTPEKVNDGDMAFPPTHNNITQVKAPPRRSWAPSSRRGQQDSHVIPTPNQEAQQEREPETDP